MRKNTEKKNCKSFVIYPSMFFEEEINSLINTSSDNNENREPIKLEFKKKKKDLKPMKSAWASKWITKIVKLPKKTKKNAKKNANKRCISNLFQH